MTDVEARPAPTAPCLADVAAAAAVVAAEHAADVDAGARFPQEALDVLRSGGALSALVPTALGGGGQGLADVARACEVLGRACSATAMVFAMHQIQVACLVRHVADDPFFADYLRRLSREQRLIGSVTSEVTTGGDMGRSTAAVTPAGDGTVSFTKQAPTISYGLHAHDLLTTLRRDPDAEATDQVLVLSTQGQHELSGTGTWDTLGMRGTCSPGSVLTATVPAEQVVPVAYAPIAIASMVPVSHVLWAHLWLGIADEAFSRARAFVRAGVKRGGVPGPAGQRLSRLAGDLAALRAEVQACLDHFERADLSPGREDLVTMAAVLRYNTLKIAASEGAADICLAALRVTGFPGYKNGTPFSVGRQLRDALSAAAMVSNDRLHETNAGLLMVVKEVR